MSGRKGIARWSERGPSRSRPPGVHSDIDRQALSLQ